jgi:hypothetical protein
MCVVDNVATNRLRQQKRLFGYFAQATLEAQSLMA